MYRNLKGAIVAVAVAGAALAIAGPASAQDIGVGVHVGGVGVGIGVGVGDVAYGYRDGYWDSGHRWHQWRNNEEMRNYRKGPNNHYNDWKHDRDRDQGWRG